MNERIIELADKAGLKVNADGELSPAYFGSVDAGYRKFAELIVQECVQACINEGKTFEVESAGEYSSNLYASAIKRHFGVEE